MSAPEPVTHEQAIELLPWLVSGSLADAEQAAVLEHARFCVACKLELDSLGDIQQAIAGESAAQPVPAPDMRRINRRIDDLTAHRNRIGNLRARFAGLFANPWRAAFVAQAVVLVVAVAVWLGREPVVAEFTTLTRSQELPAGDYVRVVFSPELGEAQITPLLDELKLDVVAGPSERGIYTLSVVVGMDREAVLTALRGNAKVLLAEPAHARGLD